MLFSPGDPDDPRIGDVARTVDTEEFEKSEWEIAVIGFPDDRGIALNHGRPGAVEGPDAIRKRFYRLVAPTENSLQIADLGDLRMTESLEGDHAAAADAIRLALLRAKRVTVLGGGHDWGFAPISAQLGKGRIGFINFDAHLDVRQSSVPHSGTSYRRALEAGVRGEDAIWFGVQRSATAKQHERYVMEKGGKIFFAGEENNAQAFLSATDTLLSRCGGVDVSLDMDVFSTPDAPGVSAPQPTGLEARAVFGLLSKLLSSPKVQTFGIYETSPPLDLDDRTSRLAARCLWEACRAIIGGSVRFKG